VYWNLNCSTMMIKPKFYLIYNVPWICSFLIKIVEKYKPWKLKSCHLLINSNGFIFNTISTRKNKNCTVENMQSYFSINNRINIKYSYVFIGSDFGIHAVTLVYNTCVDVVWIVVIGE